MASGEGVTVIPVPGGISPRSASGFLFIPTLRIMERLGFLTGIAEEVENLVSHLKTLYENLKPEQSGQADGVKAV